MWNAIEVSHQILLLDSTLLCALEINRQRSHANFSITDTLLLSAERRLAWTLPRLQVILHSSWRRDLQNKVFGNTLQLRWVNRLVNLIDLCKPSIILVGMLRLVHGSKLLVVLRLDENGFSSYAVSVTQLLLCLVLIGVFILIFHLNNLTEIEFDVLNFSDGFSWKQFLFI
jgi:hypothetical protein